MPRNQGGSDDISNLQALCLRCNAAKRWEAGCVFCALEGSGRVLLENELALCIADAFPVTPGHSLVITRRHGADGLALHQQEWNAVVELLKLRREQLSWEAIGVDRGMNNVLLSQLISRSSDLILREEGVKVEDAFGEARGSIAVATFYQT